MKNMDASEQKHILVVDDHAVVRRGFRQLLDEQPDLTAAWEAATPSEVMAVIAEHAPDLVLMDVTLGGGAAGIDLIKQVHTQRPDVPVLTVSMHDERLYAQRALAAGAQGYVTKRVPDAELLRAVRAVLEGRVYVSEAVKERIAEPASGNGTKASASPIGQFSDRELEVFLLLGKGFAPRHIAEKLHLSVKTIETYRRHLKQKLNLDDSAELTRYAVAWRTQHGVE